MSGSVETVQRRTENTVISQGPSGKQMAPADWVTGGGLNKGPVSEQRGKPQRTVQRPQRGQEQDVGDGPGLKGRGQEAAPSPETQSHKQEKQRPRQPRAGSGRRSRARQG